MKKISTVFLAVIALCLLSACNNISTSDNSESTEPYRESTQQTAEYDNTSTENTLDNTTENAPTEQDGNGILIAYFSRWGNTDYPDGVDATTSASIVVDGNNRYGTTEYVANMIKEQVGGDMYRIETAQPYTADFDELRDINHDEMNRNYLPELKESDLDITKYDTVFIGYPIWATDAPRAVISFLAKYDLSGKTVIPFCTHDGYGAGSSYTTISGASHAAKILDGLAIKASDVPTSKETVADWLAEIGISADQNKSEESGETPIKITIGDIVLDGVIYDTELAKEIAEHFPLTVSMIGYGGREYYGGIEFAPQNVPSGQLFFENGDITYCSTNNTVAIFYAQTDRPNLTMEVVPIGKVNSELSVFDTLGSREEITFSLK